MRVVITKQIQFQGQQEQFSNGYNFQIGTNPATAEFAEELALAVRDAERPIHGLGVSFVYAVAGLLGEDALWSETFATPLTGSGGSYTAHPELCVLAESKVRNRVYLRKWYHTGNAQGAQNAPDELSSGLKTDLVGKLAFLTDGSLPGAVKACTPTGALATDPFHADNYFRTHQFRARGKRPSGSG